MNTAVTADPRSVQVATVVKAGNEAATLTREDGAVAFAYTPEYLQAHAVADPDDPRIAVATSLPVTGEPVRTAAGALPPFFSGLLPEGRRLTNLRRKVKTSADDELSLLLAVGHDLVGDICVQPQGQAPQSALEQEPARTRSFAQMDFTDLLASAGVVDPVAIPGVQDKVSGRLITVPLTHNGHAHLLKISPPEYPLLVENEAFFLALAARGKLQVVAHQVVRDRHARAGLLIERFDRLSTPDGLQRLPVEDASQVLGLYPADKYSTTTEEVATNLAGLCPARLVALRSVFTQAVLAWLTGNGDLHAKNFSLVARDGEWAMTPIYDIPATAPYGDTTMALPVQGRVDGLSHQRWLAFAEQIGLPQKAAQVVIEQMLSLTATLSDDVEQGAIPLDQRRLRDWARLLKARRRHLQQ